MAIEKTAFVFGASGLVGSRLVKELIQNPHYSYIYLVVRKTLAITNLKVKEIALEEFETFDFAGINKNDVHVFCCVGTTIKKAGSQESFRKVDYELPVRIANWAKISKIQTLVVVSSIGANEASKNFYLRTKGEMESALITLRISRLFLIRPSLLLGTRNEFRLGEEFARLFSNIFNPLFFGSLKKYKALDASKVARAMMILANSNEKGGVFESDKLIALS